MCGIAGRVNAARERSVDAGQLAEALRLMAHRGPDGEGLHFQQNAGLGHRRLSIIDLATGGQPMSNEDRTIWVTFNGEIYNHAALREELMALGHRFATRSDTEVLVHGYEEWGDELPTRLRGMFAFGLWDGPRRRLLLVRDRLGIKPVYWAMAGQDLVFASEIKALFAFPEVERRLDASRVPDYFALRYVPGPATLFKGIERLQPGHRLVFEDGVARVEPFWDVPLDAGREDGRPRDVIEEAEALGQMLLESTRLRLMAEVPVGVFLSGGIDSSAVAWAMKRADPAALKSFSVGYEGDSEGELAWARLAAQAIGTEHREVAVDAATFGQSMASLAWHLDEPLSDGACIPLMHLARRAREEVVVVLSGEGADEVLAGYPVYAKMLALERARALGGPALDRALGLAQLGPWSPKLSRWIRRAREPLPRAYLGVGRGFDDTLVEAFFGAKAMRQVAERNAPLWSRTESVDPLHRMLYLDTKVWLPDDLLIKADKMTMAHSIELRVPFLDHELLAYAWSLPGSLKLQRGVGKRLLRVAMAGKLPEGILTRAKKGFPVPLTRWLRAKLHEQCRARLLATGSAVRTIFGARALERMLDEHRAGRVDRREELFSLWVFEEWYEAFLGRSARLGLRGLQARPAMAAGVQA
ncbi:MAG: asparagine synthase (glutamine-hydrolyzing) [Myxococcales bacterium]